MGKWKGKIVTFENYGAKTKGLKNERANIYRDMES